VLLGVVVAGIFLAPPVWQLANIVLLILTFVTDGVDGYVARKRGETSRFGAVFDIAADRIVEWTLWVVFTYLSLVPLWVLLVFIVRGIIVDAIRSVQAAEHRQDPFSTIVSPLGKWLVAGQFMRIGYAVLKATTFTWLLLNLALQQLLPLQWLTWLDAASVIGTSLVLACVGVCLVRGAPVVYEFVARELPELSANPNVRRVG
jgi:CDP-diacylglycerol--glycerol-3-phosphate 3-phosphatidyltransferase